MHPAQISQTALVTVSDGKAHFKVYNDFKKPLRLSSKQPIGILDMRSFGYFFCAQHILQSSLSDSVNWFTEEQTLHYLATKEAVLC